MDIQNIVTDQDTALLDAEIEEISQEFAETYYFDNEKAEELEMLVAKAMKLGELYERKKWQESQAIPEGFVLVPKDQITSFWQDAGEPENFCSTADNFDALGDCIDLGDIMEINKHTQAHISTEKLCGTWVADFGNPIDRSRSRFFIGTKSECEAIVLENERVYEKAMIEAAEGK